MRHRVRHRVRHPVRHRELVLRTHCPLSSFSVPDGGKGRASLAAAGAWQVHPLHAHLNGLSVSEGEDGFMLAAECLQAAHSTCHTTHSTQHTASSVGRSQADAQPWCVSVYCCIACLPQVPTGVAVLEPCTHTLGLAPQATHSLSYGTAPPGWMCTTCSHPGKPSNQSAGPQGNDTVKQHCAEAPQTGCLCVNAVQGDCIAAAWVCLLLTLLRVSMEVTTA